MHKDETWQVYGLNGEVVPGEGWNSALGNPEETGSPKVVGVAVVFVWRKNMEGEIELLWQRRSEKIDRYPGDYDISAGGHINLGETPVEAAVRESREEIGAIVRKDDFEFDDGEVSEVRWVPFSETEGFRVKYAKAPLKKDDLTFRLLEEWFRQHGDL